MNVERYKELLLSRMENAHLVSGGKQINCRCKECGDSIHKKSAHFYISIPHNETEPSLYYCHKCGTSGIVSYKKLIEWDIFDQEVALDLENYNKTISILPKNNKYLGSKTYYLAHTYTKIDEKSEFKRQYICNRIGYDLSYNDLSNLKIILNLMDILEENRIQKFTRDHNILNDLDREFVGFLSKDNAFLNMRRTCPEGRVYQSIDKRYVNYKIFDKIDTSQRFYTVPTLVNLNSPNRIKLHIAEGPFDILSIFLNCRRMEEGIYTSIAGSNYLGLILYFLIDMQLPYIELHLYPDNDKFGSMDRMRSIVRKIPDQSIPVYIHKNNYSGEKDFGVPLNRINESIMRLN